MNRRIRLHIPGIPHTITNDTYSNDPFTAKVMRFSPMMRSRGFEVYHYGVETSDTGANKELELFTKEEWTDLRIKSIMQLEPTLSLEAAKKKNNEPTMMLGKLSEAHTLLTVEFNKRFSAKLKENYRNKRTDIVCLPLYKSYEFAINSIDCLNIEIGVCYAESGANFRIFESNTCLSQSLGFQKDPHNYWFVVPRPFDTKLFRLELQPEPLKIGYIGKLKSGKGCNIILEAAKRFPHVKFILCGGGDPKPFLKVENVSCIPPVRGSELPTFMGSCIAIISPSKNLESFCGVSVEAQLCGTPVICSDWGSYIETVEQFKTGLRCHMLADYCLGIQMAIDGKFDRTYIRERASGLYDMYKLGRNYEYIFKTILDVVNPSKNGWYSPDTHLKTLISDKAPRIYKFLVYYGNLPNYFQLYLDSLEINKDILTVFLITDNDLNSYIVPENLVLVKLLIGDLRKRIADFILETYNKVVLPENLLTTNYKIVDFKIVYPLLFDDLLKKYAVTEKDYVGWGDCDIIYGKFSNFIDFSENYEILGGWHGHFTAIKNTESFKKGFLDIPNYLNLITDNSFTYGTDEIAYREPLIKYIEKHKFKMFFTNNFFCDVVPPKYFHRFRANHAELPKNFFDVYNATQNISYLFYDKKYQVLSVKYDECEDMKEVLYCHLQKRSMALPFQTYEKGFYIHENKFRCL